MNMRYQPSEHAISIVRDPAERLGGKSADVYSSEVIKRMVNPDPKDSLFQQSFVFPSTAETVVKGLKLPRDRTLFVLPPLFATPRQTGAYYFKANGSSLVEVDNIGASDLTLFFNTGIGVIIPVVSRILPEYIRNLYRLGSHVDITDVARDALRFLVH